MRFPLLVCAMVSAGLLSGPAAARDRAERREQRQEQRQQQAQEQRQERSEGRREERAPAAEHRGDRTVNAARRAQDRNGGGRVLSVEPAGDGYRVKVLKDGEVRTHQVDGD